MKLLVSLFLYILALLGVVGGLWRLSVRIRDLTTIDALESVALSPGIKTSLIEEIEGTPSFGKGAEVFSEAAGILRQQAIDSHTPSERISELCRALTLYGRALEKNPYDAPSMVHWANVRQILGSVSCKVPLSDGDYHEVLARAERADPTNAKVLYASALVRLWGGEKERAFELIRKVLEMGSPLSEVQIRYVISMMLSKEDVVKILPARFPQILSWGEILNRENSDKSLGRKEGLGQLQVAALEWALVQSREGKLPEQVVYGWLTELFGSEASEEARISLDGKLSELLPHAGERPFGEYLAARAKLQEIPISRAVIEADTRPRKGTLSWWDRKTWVTIDEFNSSVGFFVPEGGVVESIQLFSEERASAVDPTLLKIYGSYDNEVWEDLTNSIVFIPTRLSGRGVVGLILKKAGFRYLKIHFDSAQRTRTFRAPLDLVVRAFGNYVRNPGGE